MNATLAALVVVSLAGPLSAATSERLSGMERDVTSARDAERVDTAVQTESRQWDSGGTRAENGGAAAQVENGSGLPRLAGAGPVEGGPIVSDSAPRAGVPAVGPETNATPYQGLIDAATKLLMAAGLLLMASSALVFLGKKLAAHPLTHAAGLAMITAGTAMAYAVLGMAAAVAALGVAIMAHGQKLQGLIFTLSGAALAYAAYKAAQGDKAAAKEAKQAARGADLTQRAEAQARLQRVLEEAKLRHVEPIPSELPDTLELPEPALPVEPQSITVDGGAMPRVEPIASELPKLELVDSSISYLDEAGNPLAPQDPTGAPTDLRVGGSTAWRNNNPGNLRYTPFSRAQGAIGADANGFAIFPDEASGRGALDQLLQSGSYRNLSLKDAIYKFAPPNENDSAGYLNTLVGRVGQPAGTLLKDLSAQELDALKSTIRQVEGWTPGRIVAGKP